MTDAADNEELDALVADLLGPYADIGHCWVNVKGAAAAITALRARVAELEHKQEKWHEVIDANERALVSLAERAESAESQLRQVKADAERTQAFVADVFDATDWPTGGGLDLFDFQDLAVKHGVLLEETRTEPCGEACHCAEYHGSDGMKDGVTCYRKVEWLLNRRNDGTA